MESIKSLSRFQAENFPCHREICSLVRFGMLDTDHSSATLSGRYTHSTPPESIKFMSRTYLTPPVSLYGSISPVSQYCEKDVCTLLVTVTAELTNQYTLLCSTIRPKTLNPEDAGV